MTFRFRFIRKKSISCLFILQATQESFLTTAHTRTADFVRATRAPQLATHKTEYAAIVALELKETIVKDVSLVFWNQTATNVFLGSMDLMTLLSRDAEVRFWNSWL